MSVGDIYIGATAVFLGAAVVATARTFPTLERGIPGPGFFPQAVGLLLTFAGVLLAVHGLWWASREGRRRSGPGQRRPSALNVLAVALAGLLYLTLVPYLGFRLTAWLATGAVMLRLGVAPHRAIPWSALLVLIIHMLYVKFLRVPLPVGVLGW